MTHFQTALLAAAIPILLLLGVVVLLIMAWKQIKAANKNTLDVKANNYRLLNKEAQQGQTVFLGDSITEFYPLAECFQLYTARTGTQVYNRGIAAETTEHLLKRLETNVLCIAPKNIVLLIGTNDLGAKVSEDQCVAHIEAILDRIQESCPKINLILEAVYPVNEHMPEFYNRFSLGSRSNEKIQHLNQRLAVLAKEKNISFLDLTADLCDDKGDFDLTFTYDGLHPSAAGYQVITRRILPLLV